MPICEYFSMTSSNETGLRVGAWNSACAFVGRRPLRTSDEVLTRVSGEYAPPHAVIKRSTRACC